MYPTISSLLEDLFQITVPLPIYTYGFLVSIAMLFATLLLRAELKRKEKDGKYLPVVEISKEKYEPTKFDFFLWWLTGILLGYKIVFLALNYTNFTSDPQGLILSFRGSWIGAIIGATIVYGLTVYVRRQNNRYSENSNYEETHPYSLSWTMLLISIGFTFLGAKTFYHIEHWENFVKAPFNELLKVNRLTFYGGLIFALVALTWYSNKYNVRPLHFLDSIAPALALAYSIGRMGCHLSGDGDWGIVASYENIPNILPEWFWAYDYPNNVINAGILIDNCASNFCHVLPEAVYPTPLWESCCAFVLFLTLWILRKQIKIPGIIFGIYLISSSYARILIEQIRINPKFDFFGNSMSQAEIISFFLLGIGFLLLIYSIFKRKKLRNY